MLANLFILESAEVSTANSQSSFSACHFVSPSRPATAPQMLEKSYILEPEEDVIPKKFVGSQISWKDPAMDVTVEQVCVCVCV